MRGALSGAFQRRAALILGVIVWLPSCGTERKVGCFEHHVRDAMALNKARLPAYSEATEGRSEPVSLSLIRGERGALLAARYFDFRARPYEARGIRLMCDLMIDLRHTPPLDLSGVRRDRPTNPLDTVRVRQHLRAAMKKDFRTLRDAANKLVVRLERHPHYHCMVRHFLESIRRAAALAPGHARRAVIRGLDPKPALAITRGVVELHLAFLGAAHRLDALALPLQRDGVPIICGDVPPIPASGPVGGKGRGL